MNVKNCSRCGRIFQANESESLCARCRDTDEEDFKVVREYVYDNPSAAIKDVSEETGVAEEKILKFLRQGKLMLKDELSMVLDCERCGKPIKTGRFCDVCTADMMRQLKSAANSTSQAISKESERQSGRGMYTKQDLPRKK